ncbi:MAG TPA: hypothetical protein VMM79_05920 [Longimicrobiales bacterium]|nr:hypothetical protein [Longimicrobiales bacterium]
MSEKSGGRKAARPAKRATLRVQGNVALPAEGAGDVELHAYVFDRAGTALGSAPVDAKGTFDVSVSIDEHTDVEIMVGPEAEPQVVRRSAAASKRASAAD